MTLDKLDSSPPILEIVAMLLFNFLTTASLLAIGAHTQVVTISGTNSPESSAALDSDGVPTGSEVSYLSYSSTVTESSGGSASGIIAFPSSTFGAANSSHLGGPGTSTSDSITLLVGSAASTSPTTTLNGTSSSTTSSPPINTQPCNNYPEFCERKFSNITFVAAHNSPFIRPSNAASNQALPVVDQLTDGIRMLQFQTHYENFTMWLCHTSCNLLNAGTLEDYFRTVTSWLRSHPYDVITILIGNSDLVAPTNFTSPITSSGLDNFVYTPPKIPMSLSDWPDLSTMILTGKRAVVFMDYMANQTEVPYLLDEFSQLWETPFSPENRSFPCTVQRPPGLKELDAKSRMYMANHNLNQEIPLHGSSLLVPNTALLNETNGVNGLGSLGAMAKNCTSDWGRPPNFLLVDYYNYGSSNGSVFEVAAMMNNVTYISKCCGLTPQNAAVRLRGTGSWILTGLWVIVILAVGRA